MELTLKIHMHQAKNPVKRMIAKIPIIKKTLFYTDGKQPGGMFNKGFEAREGSHWRSTMENSMRS